MNGAGVLLAEKDYALIAEIIGRIHRDKELSEAIVHAQTQRLEQYDRHGIEQQWRDLLQPWLPS